MMAACDRHGLVPCVNSRELADLLESLGDPVDESLLRGRARIVHEAEEMYVELAYPHCLRARTQTKGLATDLGFRAKPALRSNLRDSAKSVGLATVAPLGRLIRLAPGFIELDDAVQSCGRLCRRRATAGV